MHIYPSKARKKIRRPQLLDKTKVDNGPEKQTSKRKTEKNPQSREWRKLFQSIDSHVREVSFQ